MAAVTFSGLVHYGFLQLDDKLQVRLQKSLGSLSKSLRLALIRLALIRLPEVNFSKNETLRMSVGYVQP